MAYGFSGLNKHQNSRLSNSTNLLNVNDLSNTILPVRVKGIILDSTHPRFEQLGGWNALGAIEYEEVMSPTGNITFSIAYPLYPNIKNYPLVNEVVYLISLPDTGIGIRNTSNRKYYINIVGIWNHPHHNGYPLLSNNALLPPEQQKDYQQTQAGSVRRVTDNSTEIFLGKTFKERSNIHPLLPFEGDIIHEGRWGNSIRLGSTVKETPNNWSSNGTNGDPLIIIRNGQGLQTNEGWIPVIENINNDDSSIYVTSTQNVPLEATSTSYVSYTDSPPTSPSKYAGRQIILSSGRLLFNADEDHILLSSAKSINLNSQESVNIDTKKFIIQADKIFLGKENLANEPLLLGNATVDLLSNLIDSLKQLSDTLKIAQTAPTVPGSPASLIQVNLAAVTLSSRLDALNSQLNKITSKRNFTV